MERYDLALILERHAAKAWQAGFSMDDEESFRANDVAWFYYHEMMNRIYR